MFLCMYRRKSLTFTKKMKPVLNPLRANPEKWSNTLKQIVGNLPTICLSVFDHFMNLALKGLSKCFFTLFFTTQTFFANFIHLNSVCQKLALK